jgi:NAD(P)-dependent dehydrogenase (short-subunit alcohol dehydrogenase family)
MEFAKQPLRVNAIAPGGVMTNLLIGFAIPEGLDDDLFGRYAGYRELGQPEVVAELFAYVPSVMGMRMNGSMLRIDNGVTAG